MSPTFPTKISTKACILNIVSPKAHSSKGLDTDGVPQLPFVLHMNARKLGPIPPTPILPKGTQLEGTCDGWDPPQDNPLRPCST